MDTKEKIIEAFSENPINTIEEATNYLEENGIKIYKRRLKGSGFRKRWILSFPYQDLDAVIPNKEGVIQFCRDNKELIKSKWERWKNR